MATKITSRVIAPGAVTAEALAPGVGAGPVIANVQIANSSYVALDDTAVALDGGYILINGENFGENVQVIIANTNATSVTYISSSLVRAQVPAKSAGSYIMYLVNTDTGATAIRVNAVTYSGTPTWSTDSTLTGSDVDEAISIQLSASSDTSVTYQLQTGSTLPSGLTLAANGLLSGTVTGLNEDTLYNFTIEAVDAENQDSPRAFSITITAGDQYINSVVLALNADSNTFITDASTNSFVITPNGDTRPSAFSPYNTSWSNYFDGTGDYLTIPDNALFQLGTSDFTLETYVYPPTTISSFRTIHQFGASSVNNYSNISYSLYVTSSGYAIFIGSNGSGEFVTLTSSVLLPINAWTHLAVIRSGSSFVLYQNGISVATGTSATSFHLPASPLFWTGRNHNSAPSEWLGYISNSRLIKGTALYTSNFTPPTSPLTAISGTSLLTCQSNRFIDNSTNNFTITRNGDVKVTSFAPFAETDTTTGSGYFDSTGDYLSINDSSNFASPGSGDFTLSAWIYLPQAVSNALGASAFYHLKNDTGTSTTVFIGEISSGGAFNLSTGTALIISGTAGLVRPGQWNHLVASRVSGTLKTFVNGVQDKSISNSTTYNGSVVQIGAWRYSNSDFSINGYISDLQCVKGTALYTSNFTPPTSPLTAIANTSLLTLQNRISYNTSQPVDESGVKNIVTRVGNASVGSYTPHTPAGWSAYFDGTGDYLSASDNAAFNFSTGNFTVEAWIYRKGSAGGSDGIFSNGPTSGGSFGFYVNSGVLRCDFYAGTSLIGTTPVPINTWTHVAVTRSGTTLRLFLNGVVEATTSAGDNNTTSACAIGRSWSNYGTDEFEGYVSNLRIVKGTAVYTSNFTPSTTPLEPVTNTSLLTLRGPSFTDDGPNRFAITRNGDTRITPFSPFKTHTIVPDSHSVFFDGTGDFLTVANNAAFAFGTSDFTVEGWINTSSLASEQAIFDSLPLSGNYVRTASFVLVIAISGSLRFYTNSAYSSSTSNSVTIGQWFHFAMVRSSGTIKIYINGIEGLSVVNGTNFSDNGCVIGRYSDASNAQLIGYISNLRIIKGTALYTANFTPSTTPLTNVANTSLLTCQSSTVIDNSNNALAITVNGNAQPSKYNPFGETVTTGVQYSPANHGGSYYFDGTGDYLTVPDSVDTEFGSRNFTIELWFYANQITASTQLLGKDWWTPFYFEGSNLVTYLSSNGSTWDIASNQVIITSPSPRTWYHVAMVRNGTSIRAYVNGALALSLTSSAALYDGNYPITIARRGTTDFNGYISNIRIIKGSALYTSAFVPPAAPPSPVAGTTLLLNGTNAAIADGVGKNVLETVGNARIINGTKKYGTGSMYFDGTGDYLIAPSTTECSFETGDFTIDCWINPTLTTNTDRCIWETRSSAGDSGMVLFINNNGNLSTFTSGAIRITSSVTVTANVWQHIALVRSSGTMAFYIGGTQSGTLSYSSAITCPGSVRIGVRNDGAQPYTGYIDDLRITKGIARYTSNFTPPTSSFKLK